MAGSIVSLFVFWFPAYADVLIVPAASGGTEAQAVAAMVNSGMRLGFMITAILAVVETVREAVRLVRRLRGPRYSSF